MSDGGMTLQALGGVNSPCGWYCVRGQLPSTRGQEHTHTDSITDSGATQIFVMDGTPVVNKQKTTHPLRVALADGRMVTSMHMCDIHIKGLPITLTGHMIPEISVASLFGIRVLTAALPTSMASSSSPHTTNNLNSWNQKDTK